MEQFISTHIRFWYTLLIVFILARFLYYRNQGKKEILFTYILLSVIISLLCILISRVEISLGFALGIFAILGIVRYRTTELSPREMTYLFLCVGTSAKNILAPVDLEFYRILISDVSVVLIAALAEYFLFRGNSSTKSILYNNLELINPNKRADLETDLDKKYGISGIKDIQVSDINEVKKFAKIIVNYNDKRKL